MISERNRIYKERLQALKDDEAESKHYASIDEADKDSSTNEKKQSHHQPTTDWHRSINLGMEQWIDLNHPIGIVENKKAREHAKYPECHTTQTVLDTAFHVMEIVEEKITKKMKKSPGCQLVYNSWTKNGTHFLVF